MISILDFDRVFYWIFLDGSGAIGIDELESAMKNFGLEAKRDELELIIEEVDQVTVFQFFSCSMIQNYFLALFLKKDGISNFIDNGVIYN